MTGEPLPDTGNVCRKNPSVSVGAPPFAKGDRVMHKLLGMGSVERVDNELSTCFVRFVVGVRPISFDYDGLVKM